MTTQYEEAVKSLLIEAESRGIPQVLKQITDLDKAFGQATGTVTISEGAIRKYERSLLPLKKAEMDLKDVVGVAYKMVAADANNAARAVDILVAGMERHQSVMTQTAAATDKATAAIEAQRQAYIEQGKAIRDAARHQEFYNKIHNVKTDRQVSPEGQEIAAQMERRFIEAEEAKTAATKAEVARREKLEIESLERQEAAQRRINARFGLNPLSDEQKAVKDTQNQILVNSMAKRDAEIAAEVDRREKAAAALAEKQRAAQQKYSDLFTQGRVRDAAKFEGGRVTSDPYGPGTVLVGGLSGKSAADSAKSGLAKKAEEDYLANARSVQSIRTAYDDAYRAQQKYVKDVKEVHRLHREGALVGKDYEQTLGKVKEEFQRVWKEEVMGGREKRLGQSPEARLNLHQARNLGFQMNDILTGALSGQSPFMIMAQQGGQIVQILGDGPGGVLGSFKRLGTYLGSLITPVTVLTTGILAFGAAAVMSAKDAADRFVRLGQAINGLGGASGLNAIGLMDIATSAANRSDVVSIKQSQNQAAAYARTGMDSGLIQSLTGDLTDQFAKAFGLTAEQATQTLANAFKDTGQGARDLAKLFGTVSDAQIVAIQRQRDMGNVQESQRMLMQLLNKAMLDVTPQFTELTHMSERVSKVFSDMWTRAGQRGATAIGRMMGMEPSTGEKIQKLEEELAAGRKFGIDRPRVDEPKSIMSWLTSKRGNADYDLFLKKEAELANLRARSNDDAIKRDKIKTDIENAQRAEAMAQTLRAMDPFGETVKKLKQDIEGVQKVDPKLIDGATAEKNREAIARWQAQLETMLPPLQELQRQTQFDIQSTLAMTAAQKVAIEAERTRINALNEGLGPTRAAAMAESDRAKAVAAGAKASADAYIAAIDQLRMAGRTNRDRSTIEQEIRMRELRQRTEIGAPGAAAALNNIIDDMEQQAIRRNRGSAAIRQVLGYQEDARDVSEQIQNIREAMKDLGNLFSEEQIAEAIQRFTSRFTTMLNPMQQMQLQGALQIQQTLAMTAAQRAAVEQQRAYIQALASHKTVIEALAAAEIAVNQARAEGLRQAMETNRDARQNSRLAGLLPDERVREQNRITIENLRRQTEVGQVPQIFVPFKQGLDTATAALARFAGVVSAAGGGGAGGINAAGVPGAGGSGAPAGSLNAYRAQGGGGNFAVNTAGLDAGFRDALKKLEEAIPGMVMTSGFRDSAKQAELFAKYGPGKAAPPGGSNHEFGLAADYIIPGGALDQARKIAATLGLRINASNGGAVHIEPINARALRTGVPAGATGNPNGGLAVDPNAAKKLNNDTASQLELQRTREIELRYIKQTDIELNNMNRSLQSQIDVFGRSTAETVRAAKLEEMLAQARREGLKDEDITALRSRLEERARLYGDFAQRQLEFDEYKQKVVSTFDFLRSSSNDLLSSPLKAWAAGEKPGEAARQAGLRIGGRMIDMGVNSFTEILLGKQGKAGGGLLGGLLGFPGDTTTGNMNVKAAVVNVDGAAGGAGGVGGIAGLVMKAFGFGGGGGGGGDGWDNMASFSGSAGDDWSFAKGGAFWRGREIAFAGGGLFESPARFQMAGGIGKMAEAGPEAILPLSRTPGGQLGVIAAGAGRSGPTRVEANFNFTGSITQEAMPQVKQLVAEATAALKKDMVKNGAAYQNQRAQDRAEI